MFTDAIADIDAPIITKARGGVLEIDTLRDLGQVGPSQVCTTTDQLRELRGESGEDGLAQLARGNGRVSRTVYGEGSFPAVRQFASNTSGEFSVFCRVFLPIRREELVPIRFELRSPLTDEVVDLLYFGRNEELLLGEAPLLFKLLDIIGLESCQGISLGKRLERTS